MMITHSASFLSNICLILLPAVSVVLSEDFYCQNGVTQEITGQTEGVIKTRETKDGFSGNNLQCSWVIKAGTGHRVQLSIDLLDLQWSPNYATCSDYDNLGIREGIDNSGAQITSVCHARNPYNVVSKGSSLFLQMSTTPQDFGDHRGIELTFQTFSNTSCPPGWFQSSATASTCFMFGSSKLSWPDSHDVCAHSLANLASVLSAMEHQVIMDHGRNLSVDLAWIGLSDLRLEKTYMWVDDQSLDYKRAITGYGFRTHCIAQDFSSGNWKALNCEKNLLNYICKAKKDGSTVLYPPVPPSPPPEEGEGGSKAYLAVIIGVVFVVALGVCLFIYFCYCRRNNKCKSKQGAKQTGGAESVQLRGSAVPSAPLEPSTIEVHVSDPQMVAPPSYEESQTHPVIY